MQRSRAYGRASQIQQTGDLNSGPGDPGLAHTREEAVDLRQVRACANTLRAYLTRA